MADVTTTVLSDVIPTEVFDRALQVFMNKTHHLSMLGNEIEETAFLGRGGKITVPKFSSDNPATGTLDESTGSTDAGEFTASSVDISLQLYGDRVETLTALGEYQSYDQRTLNKIINAIGSTAALTMEWLIAKNAVAKTGTSSTDSGSEDCKWEVISPDPDDLDAPRGNLTTEILENAVAQLKTQSDPFDDGYYRGFMPPQAISSFQNTVRSSSESLVDFATLSGDPILRNEYKHGMLGAWKGVLWRTCDLPKAYNPYVLASGAGNGADAYKTLIFGKQYLRGAFTPYSELAKLNSDPAFFQTPLNKYIAIKVGPDRDNSHGLNWKVTFLFYGGTKVTNNENGLYLIHTADNVTFGS